MRDHPARIRFEAWCIEQNFPPSNELWTCFLAGYNVHNVVALKAIALSILDKYRQSKIKLIDECSRNMKHDFAQLDLDVKSFEAAIAVL